MKKKISGALNMNWLSSSDSVYGHGGSAKLSTNILGYNLNWLEWGYHSEHMEELAMKLVNKVKIWAKHSQMNLLLIDCYSQTTV